MLISVRFIIIQIPYTAHDSHQLVQRRAALFVKTDNRQITSVSELISRVKMAVIVRLQEKRLSVSVLQGSAWSGSYPRE